MNTQVARQRAPFGRRDRTPAHADTTPKMEAGLDVAAHARFGHNFSNISVEAEEPIQRVGDASSPANALTAPKGHDRAALGDSGDLVSNKTGLPDALKAGVESLSGLSLEDVRVHFGSGRPAGVGALAFAQGSDIHLGPGQERHLPHEAWHVVQQKQGRVAPTVRAGGQPVNDSEGLEREADAMGSSAGAADGTGGSACVSRPVNNMDVVQRASAASPPSAPVIQRVKTFTSQGEEIDTEALPEITDENRQRIQSAIRMVKDGKVRTDAKGKKTRFATDQEKGEADAAYPGTLKGGGSTPEDPAMRAAIEKRQSGQTTKQRRQVVGLHNFYEQSADDEKDQMSSWLGKPENASGLTDAVREGAKNETLLTSDVVEATQRSLGKRADVFPSNKRKSGGSAYWTDVQSETSYPTSYFHFPNTTTGEDGKEYQDTHINGSTYRLDDDGKKHLTVGNTSRDYHLGSGPSLHSNLLDSRSPKSHSNRNIKFHSRSLAREDDILSVPHDERMQQFYQTSGGRTLDLSKEEDLEHYAVTAQVHRDKVMTGLHKFGADLDPRGDESESEPDDYSGDELGMDVDTDDEVEERLTKRQKRGS